MPDWFKIVEYGGIIFSILSVALSAIIYFIRRSFEKWVRDQEEFVKSTALEQSKLLSSINNLIVALTEIKGDFNILKLFIEQTQESVKRILVDQNELEGRVIQLDKDFQKISTIEKQMYQIEEKCKKKDDQIRNRRKNDSGC